MLAEQMGVTTQLSAILKLSTVAVDSTINKCVEMLHIIHVAYGDVVVQFGHVALADHLLNH